MYCLITFYLTFCNHTITNCTLLWKLYLCGWRCRSDVNYTKSAQLQKQIVATTVAWKDTQRYSPSTTNHDDDYKVKEPLLLWIIMSVEQCI